MSITKVHLSTLDTTGASDGDVIKVTDGNVAFSTAGGGVTVYDTIDNLPTTGNSTGDQAFVSGSNRLYIWNGSGWYNIALINTDPSFITGPESTYALATNQSVTTISLLATDPEGITVAYSAVPDADFSNLATISQSANVFTITPADESNANTTSGTVTFRASDGINLATSISTFTLLFRIENTNFTSALIKASGNNGTNTALPVDNSSNNYTITAPTNTPTSQAFTPHHPGGYSTYFDGSGDYVQVASSSDFAFGSNDFTIEFWAYPEAIATAALLDPRTTDSQAVPWIGLRNTGYFYYYVSGSNRIVGTTGTVTANKWYHVAVSRSSGTTKMFVNGTQIGSDYSDSTSYVQGGPWRTGTRYNNTTLPFNGYIRDFRCINGTALYTADFTTPTKSLTAVTNTKLLHSHLLYIADGSTSNHTITANGNVYTQRFGPYDYGPYSVSSHGASVYIESKQYTVVAPNWKNGTTSYSGEFTYEGWFYFTENDGFNSDVIVSEHSGGSDRGLFWYNNAYYAVLASDTSDWSGASAASFGTIKKGWHHIALVRHGDILKPFVNGVQGTTTTLSTGAALNFPNVATRIGSGYEGWESTDDFYLGEFRVVWGSAVYTSDFTPPTAPLTAITNTSLLLQSSPNVYDASGSSNLTLHGNAQSSTTQTKNASSSIYFDGSGDYLSIPDSTNFGYGTGNFTIEFWVYFNDVSSTQSIISNLNTTSGLQPHLYITSGTIRYYTGSVIRITSSAVNTDQWYHIVLEKNNSSTKLYIDGTQSGSTYTDSNNYGSSAPLAIANYWNGSSLNSSSTLNGFISDVRITKGLARYTNSFTPPASELLG